MSTRRRALVIVWAVIVLALVVEEIRIRKLERRRAVGYPEADPGGGITATLRRAREITREA